ncbi:MAG: hypothetical protein CMK00_03565 [Planctomycetes bacterium]|jgi:hypothetical protein|nr:hypothetical protein [Planctomycetota bacterium]HJO26263.1 hypothetical protein [Planctomycetota bacterium]
MVTTFLLSLLVASSPLGIQNESTGAVAPSLLASCGAADPLCATGSPDGEWVYLQEGTLLRRLAHVERGQLLESGTARLDALAHVLVATSDAVWVAAGEGGLLKVHFSASGKANVRSMAIPPEAEAPLLCVDVWADGGSVWSLFSSSGGSAVGKYSADGELLHHHALAGGRLFSVAGRGATAWLGGERGWLGRLTWDAAGTAHLEEGPALGDGDAAPVLDLALGAHFLHAACDGPAVVTLDPLDWDGSNTPRTTTPIGRSDGHAAHLSFRGEHLAVGLNRGPHYAMSGAPYGLCGTMGPGFTIGDTDPATLRLAPAELLAIARETTRGLRIIETTAVGPHGWRSLYLGVEQTVECHLSRGLELRPLPGTTSGKTAPTTRRTRGFPAIGGTTSLLNPSLALFGTDSQGALIRGQLSLADGSQLVTAKGSEELLPIGLRVGAQWIDTAPATTTEHQVPAASDGAATGEWFVAGYGPAPRLFKLRHDQRDTGPTTTWQSWSILLPTDGEGKRGHTYYHSTRAEDLVLITRYGTRDGLLAYALGDLTDAAAGVEPGGSIKPVPLWSAATQAQGERHPAGALDVSVLDWPDQRRVAVVAAGHDSPTATGQRGGPRMVVVELTRAAPRLLAEFTGPCPGTLVAVDCAWVDDRPLACLADLAGRLWLFDLTDPAQPRQLEAWTCPPHPWGGFNAESLFDVVIDGPRGLALVAAGRRGVLAVSLAGARPKTEWVVDTPGMAEGLHLQRVGSRSRLWVGDQKGGLRVYALGP